ncbi:hypothetical protein ON010_g8652 [Phytophthora cinnamomi]|nr:hypothetical protein ON010_g8652 [Phytophthora cinnamomi]
MVKRFEDVVVYQDRQALRPRRLTQSSSGSGYEHQETPRDMQKLLWFGSVQGSLDDIMYGVVNATAEEAKVKAAYVGTNVLDFAVLQAIVRPTVDDPFRGLQIKWAVNGGPTLMRSMLQGGAHRLPHPALGRGARRAGAARSQDNPGQHDALSLVSPEEPGGGGDRRHARVGQGGRLGLEAGRLRRDEETHVVPQAAQGGALAPGQQLELLSRVPQGRQRPAHAQAVLLHLLGLRLHAVQRAEKTPSHVPAHPHGAADVRGADGVDLKSLESSDTVERQRSPKGSAASPACVSVSGALHRAAALRVSIKGALSIRVPRLKAGPQAMINKKPAHFSISLVDSRFTRMLSKRFPLSASPFAPLRISQPDETAVTNIANDLLVSTFVDYEMLHLREGGVVNPARWKAVKRFDNLVGYQERKHRRKLSGVDMDADRCPRLVWRGTLEGSLSDIMYGVINQSDGDAQAKAANTVTAFQGAADQMDGVCLRAGTEEACSVARLRVPRGHRRHPTPLRRTRGLPVDPLHLNPIAAIATRVQSRSWENFALPPLSRELGQHRGDDGGHGATPGLLADEEARVDAADYIETPFTVGKALARLLVLPIVSEGSARGAQPPQSSAALPNLLGQCLLNVLSLENPEIRGPLDRQT